MQHRPQYHFTPESCWMNDPNGLVYFNNEYHLFYQFHPGSNTCGPMHWGHAVSRDMVHWEHLPIALSPDSLGYIFSGSAVIDWKNTSGLGQAGNPAMILIFTHHNMNDESTGAENYEYQSIAYSNDKGRTWKKYHGNPVLPNPGIKDFRDPKVIWHEQTGRWIMVLAAFDKVMIYSSPNLTDWAYASEFGAPGDKRLWECPDLFPLKVEGTDEVKWILLVSIQNGAPNTGSATGYFVGIFDGMTFSADLLKQKWTDYGKDNYAMVTWSDIPETDGRKLAIGWMSNWQYAEEVPTSQWRGTMTLPRELSLHKEEDNYHLRFAPINELTSLKRKTFRLHPQVFEGRTRINVHEGRHLYNAELTFEDPVEGITGVRISNASGEHLDVYYHAGLKMYCIDRTKAGTSDFNDTFAGVHYGKADYDRIDVQMTIFLDVGSVELFADQGRCVITEIFFPSVPFDRIEILADANPVVLIEGYLTELQSAW